MGVVLMGVIWVWSAMIWAWTGGVASVLELVFKKLEPMLSCLIVYCWQCTVIHHLSCLTVSTTVMIELAVLLIKMLLFFAVIYNTLLSD